MKISRIASRQESLAERLDLLAKEKAASRQLAALAEQRRALSAVPVDKDYVFDGADGVARLIDLFEGRSQLIVYHFMFSPSWKEGCVGCSFFSDHVDGAEMHIKHHDVSFVAISRAPLAALDAYKKRMGWRFNWVSSDGSDFNYDFHVSFTKDELARGEAYYNYEMTKISTEDLHGLSVFFKDETGSVFLTYSSFGRGDERGLGAYMFLDLTPKGRNETGPNKNLTDWVRRHDKYAEGQR